MTTPCPAPFNLADHVLTAGRSTPDKVALCLVGRGSVEHWSFARIEAAVLGTGTGLLDEGMHPGDRVLMRLGNGPAFPIAFLGAISVGLIPVPTSVDLTESEVARVADIVRPRAILASDGVAVAPGIPVIDEAKLIAMSERPAASPVLSDPDRPAYIIMTSGTSGTPRAVVHAHRAIWARRMMWDGWYGLTSDDRLCHAGAFNWTYTLGTGLLDPWSVGATALIPAPGVTPAELPPLLRRHDATIFAAAPGIYRRLLRDQRRLDLPNLRHGLSAGEKLPESIREAWTAAVGCDLHEAYGQSEMSTFVSGSPARPAPPGTLGFAQPGRRVAVIADDGAPVPEGQPGTIAVHRSDPGLMLGYLDGQATALPLVGDWYPTGDTGLIGADGSVTYLGRNDDMMNAGGHRVSPVEVEAAMTGHPSIEEAAAAEVEVKADTRVIALFYAGAAADDADLAAFARQRLAAYKVPRVFVRMGSLPRGANGKLLRRQLRESYAGTS